MNDIEFKVYGRQALFTDPLTKIGGEKFSYQVPTAEALKGIAKSIYWKPTFIWVIDAVRVMKRIRTQTKGARLPQWGGGNDLASYTYLVDVEYQVKAHFEWNLHRPELAEDRKAGKHYEIARRSLKRGGRQDVFLGTRECQGYVEPCEFGSGNSHYDGAGELAFGLMFHGFDYPDEVGGDSLIARFDQQVMCDGIIRFAHPKNCNIRKTIRPMGVKQFSLEGSVNAVEKEQSSFGQALVCEG